FDVLAAPTSPTTAFRLGEKTQDPLAMYLSDVCTLPVNMAGLPGISLPCGFDAKGLPVGLQLIGRAFDESTLLRAAYAYEQVTAFHRRRPPLKALGGGAGAPPETSPARPGGAAAAGPHRAGLAQARRPRRPRPVRVGRRARAKEAGVR